MRSPQQPVPLWRNRDYLLLWLGHAIFAGIALSDSIRAIFMDSYRFAIVPDTLQGRVNGVYRLILFSVLTINFSALELSLEHLGGANRGHRVEWPASDHRISVSLSAQAASGIPTRVNPTMLLSDN